MNKKYIAPTVEITEIPEEVIIATSDEQPTLTKGVGEGSHVAETKMFDFSSEDEDFDF